MIDLSKAVIHFDYKNATLLDEASRNLKLLLNTPAGTCPGMRDFGISQEYLDYPMEAAKNLLALEIIEKVDKYEPRVIVSEIDFAFDTVSGNLTPSIHIDIADVDTVSESDTTKEWK